MTAPKNKLPSQAQAKKLAWLWSGDRAMDLDVDLLNSGWIEPTGETVTYCPGDKRAIHKISQSGLHTLEDYLRECRFKGRLP